MITPNDILLRETSDGTTVWVSQRLVVEVCGMSEGLIRINRTRYKKGLPLSWQAVAEQSEFFLGAVPGRSWRWGRRSGQFYYDVDTIPNRAPVFYRDRLPSKAELITMVDESGLRGNRERQAERRRTITEQVALMIDNTDIRDFTDFAIGDKNLFDLTKARQLTEAAAWCRFIKHALATGEFKRMGFPTKDAFFTACAEILAPVKLEGMRIKTPAALRKKIVQAPDDPGPLRSYLVSGKYCNDNARKVGKYKLIDYTTGEILTMDEHEVMMMTYWLNPGGSTKDSKRAMWEAYAADMYAIGKEPVKQSTFNHYTNTWAKKVRSFKERHGKKVSNELFRPYVPAKPLEFANSLWASDGSGVVPYRYQDQYGKWRMMKLYTMLVSDVASRYIAGYAVSRKSQHVEDFTMTRAALRMALLDNGRTEALDFISDRHGAYTGAESKAYLQQAFRNFRTIHDGQSQGNPAEMMFRLFKRRFKSYFNLPETSWNARSLESMANPDYYNIMALPTYSEAIDKLETAIRDWNSTELANGITPAVWFATLKNPSAGQYGDRHYRMLTGEVSRRDLSYSRGVMVLERGGVEYKFDVPTDADSVALIAKYMGYASTFSVIAYWNTEGADIYTSNGVYMFTCPPARLASKSMSEATGDTLAALGHSRHKIGEFDAMLDGFMDDVDVATAVLARNYEFNAIGGGPVKEQYNEMRERISAAEYERGLGKRQAKEQRARDREQKKEAEIQQQAVLDYCKSQISDISKYTK